MHSCILNQIQRVDVFSWFISLKAGASVLFIFLKTEPKCSIKVVAYRKKLYTVAVKKYLLLRFSPATASCTREALMEVTECLLSFDFNGPVFLGFRCIFIPSVLLGRAMIEHLGGHMASSQGQPTTALCCKLGCFAVFFPLSFCSD